MVHPRGARHMADPSKLWAGATQVYGDKTEALFGGVVPVPTEHILVREHEETLSIGRRTLQFFDSPGHAKHHFTILSEVDRALFAGDAVGIRYPTEFTGFPFEFIAPSSSPIDFDPVAVHQTLDMLLTLPFDWVYHAHFGKSLKLEAIDHTRRLADAFAAVIERIYSPDIETQTVVAELRRLIADDLERQGKTALDLRVLDIDVVLDALGLVYYEKKRRERNN
ncbi:hypothetical protein GCM10025859_26860 [Alicyclobacillus fastidiosus]|nr:hypothetical protein GCM10025859_26860 [Alicyclobacillus fastidiosus]